MADNPRNPVEELRARFPWPDSAPKVAPKDHGWFSGGQVFPRWAGPHVRTVVELGSWMGKSARWFCENCPNANVICVDHWVGSEEHKKHAEWKLLLPKLYETFLVNMWVYRKRVIPVKMASDQGLQLISELGVEPDLLYIDAAHDEGSVYTDTKLALTLFPNAHVFGDDWLYSGVVNGVNRALTELRLVPQLRFKGRIWWVARGNAKRQLAKRL